LFSDEKHLLIISQIKVKTYAQEKHKFITFFKLIFFFSNHIYKNYPNIKLFYVITNAILTMIGNQSNYYNNNEGVENMLEQSCSYIEFMSFKNIELELLP